MGISTKRYKRKPIYVDAVQVTPDNFMALAVWCQGEILNNDGTETDENTQINPGAQHIKVRVHNPKDARQTRAYVGDWILYTDRGYKIYTQGAFEKSFEPVDGEEKDAAVQAEKAAEAGQTTEITGDPTLVTEDTVEPRRSLKEPEAGETTAEKTSMPATPTPAAESEGPESQPVEPPNVQPPGWNEQSTPPRIDGDIVPEPEEPR
jgi:hypothetical protein